MLSNELRTFCNRWLEKSDKYGESTEDIFDKFFSLYVVYNAIYFEITIELINSRSIGKNQNWDKVSAVENIPIYVGQKKLSDTLFNMIKDINVMIGLIKDNTFYISTKNDNHTANHERDQEMIDNIETFCALQNKKNQKRFNEAVLELIYGARCNMFHGKKEFKDQQIDLLIPMNNILEMIIKDLLLVEKGRV